MPAYPLEFRKKIVSAYEAGDTSIRKVAKRFMVTKRTVQRLITQHRETVEQPPDWALWQYCEEIAKKTGLSVSTEC